MMTTPPMVVAMDTGYFGLKLGRRLLNGVFIGSLIPHISYGIALGWLLERYVRHPGTIVLLLRSTVRAAHATPPRAGAPARTGRG